MIKSMTINTGYQTKKDNAGGNGLIGNNNVTFGHSTSGY